MKKSHIFWNLLGLSIPLIIAALTIPSILSTIGPERFGLLALSWGLIGYAGILDLGIGRAATQRIALLRKTKEFEIKDTITTALRLTIITGLIGAAAIASITIIDLQHIFKIESVSNTEIQLSILLLSTAIPAQSISATFKGINEAFLNFKGINLLRIALGAANFGLPYIISIYTSQLHWLVFSIAISRLIALLFYRNLALQCLIKNNINAKGFYSKKIAKKLFEFGGWFTVSSVLSPLLIQVDRFFIGSMIAASAITVYVLPYEIVTKSLIFVGAITSVAFPLISQLLHSSPQKVDIVFNLWLKRVVLGMGLGLLLLAYFISDILNLWIGEQLDSSSHTVGQILCIGVFFNAIGSMYFSLLHAQGKTKTTAIIHLIEVPIFIFLLIFLIKKLGIYGAAYAWVIRMIIDTSLLITATFFHKKKIK